MLQYVTCLRGPWPCGATRALAGDAGHTPPSATGGVTGGDLGPDASACPGDVACGTGDILEIPGHWKSLTYYGIITIILDGIITIITIIQDSDIILLW